MDFPVEADNFQNIGCHLFRLLSSIFNLKFYRWFLWSIIEIPKWRIDNKKLSYSQDIMF